MRVSVQRVLKKDVINQLINESKRFLSFFVYRVLYFSCFYVIYDLSMKQKLK